MDLACGRRAHVREQYDQLFHPALFMSALLRVYQPKDPWVPGLILRLLAKETNSIRKA